MIASFVVSCKAGLAEADRLNLANTPLQSVDDMFAVRTKNGTVTMRMEAPLMEHYVTDTNSYDIFPKGLSVYGYNDDGLLETVIVSNNAKHVTSKVSGKEDIWSAFGNVVIHNVIKLETMETDTIYWDQAHEEIYTDCYVKMYSDDGFMQGYGMRSDDHAQRHTPQALQQLRRHRERHHQDCHRFGEFYRSFQEKTLKFKKKS